MPVVLRPPFLTTAVQRTFASGAHPGRRRERDVRGLTLLEVLVVLALLAVAAAVALPALAPAPRHDATWHDVVRRARSVAVARAQLLSLTVRDDGTWEVRALPPGDSSVILSGAIAGGPSAPIRLQLTALGACFPASPLPAEVLGWDAAGCTALASGRGGE